MALGRNLYLAITNDLQQLEVTCPVKDLCLLEAGKRITCPL